MAIATKNDCKLVRLKSKVKQLQHFEDDPVLHIFTAIWILYVLATDE